MSTRNERRIEFGRRNDAGELRDDLPDDVLASDDDGREKVLRLDPDKLDRDTRQRIEGKAAVSRDDARGDMHGQASLSEGEKKRLDFTRTTVPEARTAKASLLAEGVSDWTAHFDPSLTTSEMADQARSTTAGGGARMDAADTQRARDRQGAQMFREVQGKQAKRAREGCEDGFEAACDELVEKHGVSRAEAEAMLGGRPSAQSGSGVTADGGLRDTTVLRSGAAGTFLREPPTPADSAPGYRNGSTGRFVGYEIDEHADAKREPNTGRIRRLGPLEPIPRDEAVDRFGHPDGPNGEPSSSRPTGTDALEARLGPNVANERMSPREDVQAQARAADVSITPDEALEGTFSDGITASSPGAFDDDPGGLFGRDLERSRREDAAQDAGVLDPNGGAGPTLFEMGPDELPGGFERVDERSRQAGDISEVRFERDAPGGGANSLEVRELNGEFEIETNGDTRTATDRDSVFTQAEQLASGLDSDPSGFMTDDRDQQASFDVGIDAGATRDREGQVAGSAGFEDRRDELGTSGTPDTGMQSGLVEQETNVGGGGQTDLFGGDANETSGAEYRT